MKKNRTKIFEELDVHATNLRWSWCAKNESLKISVFTIWKDEERDGTWLLHDDDDSVLNKRLGAKDQEEVLKLSISDSFTIYGLIAEAVNPNDSPRSIKRIDDQNLVRLRLEKKGKKIYAKKIRIVPFLEVIKNNKSNLKLHGILDLENPPLGKEFPDRALSIAFSFKRDQKVRKYVLKRAKGKCEYCGEIGFELKGGENYLETHHIISLANQGPDNLGNVIALCSNHHRQAHYGINAEDLEKEFLEILVEKNQKH
ncbi:HNH endonuclease [Cyclobacteriaceae bacterium YHN15]|nr:HNH endonuclease [Cyclobacteriaceae bacterium YHN15]